MGILRFIERVCVQTAVYWPEPVPDGYGGHTYGDPVEIKVRWDDTIEMITNREGQEIVSKATIMTPADVQEGGYLYLGKISDLSEDEKDDPRKVKKAYPVQRLDISPLYRSSTEFVKLVYL